VVLLRHKLKSLNNQSDHSGNSHFSKLYSSIEFADFLSRQTDLKQIIELVAHQATLIVPADISLIMMMNPRTRETMKTIYSQRGAKFEGDLHFLHTNICGWVIKNKRAYFSENIQTENHFQKEILKKLPFSAAICVPFRSENIIFGTLLLLNRETSSCFTQDDLHFIEDFCIIVSPYMRNIQKIQDFFEESPSKEAVLNKYRLLGLLGRSSKFMDLVGAIEAASRCDVRVLLEGESGTGKERIAQAIHKLSDRCPKNFVAVDCGAIPPNLMESELFGHIKGAFTGATTPRKGLFEEADGGTLFLDEVSNLPLELQIKLLRVLQEGKIRPVGGNQINQVDVRVISASSSSLIKLVETKKFREDLFYRLHVFPIVIPSLDDRREDIPILAYAFLRKFANQQKKLVKIFHESMIDLMKARHWPGNIRELENFVERLVTLSSPESLIIEPELLPNAYKQELEQIKISNLIPRSGISMVDRIEEFEKELIENTLMENNWNQSKTARYLQVSEQTIRYKMRKYHIEKNA